MAHEMPSYGVIGGGWGFKNERNGQMTGLHLPAPTQLRAGRNLRVTRPRDFGWSAEFSHRNNGIRFRDPPGRHRADSHLLKSFQLFVERDKSRIDSPLTAGILDILARMGLPILKLFFPGPYLAPYKSVF